MGMVRRTAMSGHGVCRAHRRTKRGGGRAWVAWSPMRKATELGSQWVTPLPRGKEKNQRTLPTLCRPGPEDSVAVQCEIVFTLNS